MHLSRLVLSVILLASFVFPTAHAQPTVRNELVAVFSKTSNGYHRTRLPDGSVKPETYAFASGGRFDGVAGDPSVENVKWLQVAGIVANAIKPRGYIGAEPGKSADLLIFVTFGTTSGVEANEFDHFRSPAQSALNQLSFGKNIQGATQMGSPGMTGASSQTGPDIEHLGLAGEAEAAMFMNQVENDQRDRVNARNAEILGYSSEMQDAIYLPPFTNTGREIVSEVEESRYFVVLKAYDYKYLERHHQKKLLWETRFSIARHDNRFDEQLSHMARYAAQFVGEDPARIIRRHLPDGKVELGTPRVIETNVDVPKNPPADRSTEKR